VAKQQTFLRADWTERFKASYADLSADRKRQCDAAVMQVIKRQPTPGLRIKPIQPDKHYREARINDGDRLIFVEDGDKVTFVDVVPHDRIERYGRGPRRQP
jgi:mRNA-degrading endonuclease RelE of RelBE toxin-antitoxin system